MRPLLYSLLFTTMTSINGVAQDDLDTLSDRFAGQTTLSTNWAFLQPEGFSEKWAEAGIRDGQLRIRPKSSGWFEDNFGGFLYKTVTGNFTVTTRLKVEGITGLTPRTAFSLAGIFVRQPRVVRADNWQPKGENWLFFSTGTADDAGKPQFEIKSTYQSTSTLKTLPARAGWMELRIVRLNEIFTLLYRYEGTTDWQLLDQFIRPDLSTTLQVGLTAYSDWPSVEKTYPDYQRYNTKGTPEEHADLIATIDWITFRRPTVERSPIANAPTYWTEFSR